MNEAERRPLAGRGIVVTRPAHQAAHLAELIRAAGGNPILFPVIEIVEVGDLQPLLALIDRLDEFDIAIFISPNAVNKAMNLIKARRALPPRLKFAAIGRGSVKELKRFGLTDVIAPARFDSEALLELPGMQDIAGRRIVIFRGDGGRELLADTLSARGATVEYAECYRRGRPQLDAAPLLKAWARNELHAITVTSSEGLHNLFDLVGKLGQSWLRKTPVFVPHPRIEQTARELGLVNVALTDQGDEGLVRGLAQWFAAGR
ncbi:MAG: uroporphyrinogen-III synthase [Betaproteobacteria bacterium]|nr:uroporphyrinogen-III synthase [Betaproteobacteria bacterium]